MRVATLSPLANRDRLPNSRILNDARKATHAHQRVRLTHDEPCLAFPIRIARLSRFPFRGGFLLRRSRRASPLRIQRRDRIAGNPCRQYANRPNAPDAFHAALATQFSGPVTLLRN